MTQSNNDYDQYIQYGIIQRHHLKQLITRKKSKLIVLSAPAGFGKTLFVQQLLQGSSTLFYWHNCSKEESQQELFWNQLRAKLHSFLILNSIISSDQTLNQFSSDPHVFFTEITAAITHTKRKQLASREGKLDLSSHDANPTLTNEFILIFDNLHLLSNVLTNQLVKIFSEELLDHSSIILISRKLPAPNIIEILSKFDTTFIDPGQLKFSKHEFKQRCLQFLSPTQSLKIFLEQISICYTLTSGWPFLIDLWLSYLLNNPKNNFDTNSTISSDIILFIRKNIWANLTIKCQNFLTTFLPKLNQEFWPDIMFPKQIKNELLTFMLIQQTHSNQMEFNYYDHLDWCFPIIATLCQPVITKDNEHDELSQTTCSLIYATMLNRFSKSIFDTNNLISSSNKSMKNKFWFTEYKEKILQQGLDFQYFSYLSELPINITQQHPYLIAEQFYFACLTHNKHLIKHFYQQINICNDQLNLDNSIDSREKAIAFLKPNPSLHNFQKQRFLLGLLKYSIQNSATNEALLANDFLFQITTLYPIPNRFNHLLLAWDQILQGNNQAAIINLHLSISSGIQSKSPFIVFESLHLFSLIKGYQGGHKLIFQIHEMIKSWATKHSLCNISLSCWLNLNLIVPSFEKQQSKLINEINITNKLLFSDLNYFMPSKEYKFLIELSHFHYLNDKKFSINTALQNAEIIATQLSENYLAFFPSIKVLKIFYQIEKTEELKILSQLKKLELSIKNTFMPGLLIDFIFQVIILLRNKNSNHLKFLLKVEGEILTQTIHLKYHFIAIYSLLNQTHILLRLDDKEQAKITFIKACQISQSNHLFTPFLVQEFNITPLLNFAKQESSLLMWCNQLFRLLDAKRLPIDSTNQQHPISLLTKREKEILKLMAAGNSNEFIAKKLIRSLGTIKLHTHHIYQKLNVKHRMAAIKLYQSWLAQEKISESRSTTINDY